ncbi:MAG: phenylalanine--tRNA ligase subunit beta, partial [Marinomonas sp.]
CPTEIRTDDLEGCPAFYGRVITGVKNGASPDWLQQRLASAGQKSISLLVDLTNYLMLAFGRPAHVYDLAKLSGAVVARRAKNGEQIVALNDKTYTLDDSMTVIADDAGVHDVAGIMGGLESGCSAETTDVLLEIAYFNPAQIGVTGRKLGLASDARTRFERGVDPAFLDDGLDLLTGLIVELGGGTASEVTRAGSPPSTAKVVAFDPVLTASLGGVDVAADEQRRILESLDFAVDVQWNVTCPLRRHDIEGPADLVEEVVRIHGLDNVASVALPRAEGVARPTASTEQKLERKLRRAAAGAGLDEAITWSFISEDEAARVGGGVWSLDNPISEDMKVMRPSLLPGLLSAVKRNVDRGASSLQLFEIGRRYLADGEHPTLVAVLAGEKAARGWANGKPTHFDAYDAKAMCLQLLEAAGAPVGKLMVMPADQSVAEVYHPGQSASLRLGPKNQLASFGTIHPAMLDAFDIDVPVVALGIHLDAIPAPKAKKGAAASFARAPYSPPALQSVTRDFAFLVPAELPAGELLRSVKGADKVNITDARVFDVFAGQGVPEGQKSVAVEVTLQPQEKSFKDAELKAISEAIVAAAEKQGASLRG